MAYKKKMMRRRPVKKSGVSKKVKQYVKKLTKTANRQYTCTQNVNERLVTCGQIFYMDEFMNYTTAFNTQGISRCQSSGMKIKYLVLNNSATTPIAVRCLILECLRGGDYDDYKSTIVSANLSSASNELFEQGYGAGLSNFDNDLPFDANGTTRNILARINHNAYKVHRDFTINLGTSANDRANFSQGTLWVPFKKIVKYDGIQGGLTETDPANTKLIFLAIPVEVPQDVVPPTQQIEVSAVATWYFRA